MAFLNGSQIDRLQVAVGDGFDMPTLSMFLRTRVGNRRLDDVSPPGATNPVRVFMMIEHAEREGWIRELLLALMAHGPNDPVKTVAREIHDEVAGTAGDGAAAAGDDPFETCLVGRRTFVDRDEIRSHLRELHGAAANLLVITGLEAAGKSLTWHYIQHVAKTQEDLRARLIDFKHWTQAGGPTPDEVIDKLATQLAFDDRSGWPPDDLAQGARRADKLLDWFSGRCADLEDHLWLVFDHLDRVDLREETLELVERLAVAVDRGTCERVSLVLIAHPRALPDEIEPFVPLQDQAATPTAADVKKHFEKVAAKKQQTLTPAQIDALVGEVFDGLAAPFDHDKMTELAARLAKHSARVLRGEVGP